MSAICFFFFYKIKQLNEKTPRVVVPYFLPGVVFIDHMSCSCLFCHVFSPKSIGLW